MKDHLNKILLGDAEEKLKTLPDQSAHCCITSPPYFGLRDYGMQDQIGLEETPEQYIEKIVSVFREVRRVLRNDGTLWINIGDTYARLNQSETDPIKNSGFHTKNGTAATATAARNQRKIPAGLKAKDLIGIPWMLAFALRSDGWFLRQDIIWHKPNPMPESITDRCTKSHEYIFLLSKSNRYYFDQESILQPVTLSSSIRLAQNIDAQAGSDRVPGKTNGNMKAVSRSSGNKQRKPGSARGCPENNGVANLCGSVPWVGNMANKRSVWTVNTKPYPDAHFATFPEELIVDCIKAGSPPGGTILDPFMGAGTTALVARKLDRNFIGIELNPKYITIAEKRLKKELGMFL